MAICLTASIYSNLRTVVQNETPDTLILESLKSSKDLPMRTLDDRAQLALEDLTAYCNVVGRPLALSKVLNLKYIKELAKRSSHG